MKTSSHDFSLIETIRWCQKTAIKTGSGFHLLKHHLERIKKSASFFRFPFSEEEIMDALMELEKGFLRSSAKDVLVRLLLDPSGHLTVESKRLLTEVKGVVKIAVSSLFVQSNDIFLYHKTTNRGLFDRERRRLQQTDIFEIIFLNQRGELTQGTITNLFLDIGEKAMATPALTCGLLPGTLRQDLLDRGVAKEAILTLSDLKKARKIFVGNSVRGLMEAAIVWNP